MVFGVCSEETENGRAQKGLRLLHKGRVPYSYNFSLLSNLRREAKLCEYIEIDIKKKYCENIISNEG